MDRPTLLPIGVAVLLFVSVALLWSVSSSPDIAPKQHTVTGLSGPASVTWHRSGVVSASIESAADEDFLLGYIHGIRRTWTLLLWRQTARGHLSTWFGTDSVPLDRHVHRLGIPADARRVVDGLPDSIQARLQAYTDGVNAALSTPPASNREPLIVLDLQPDPWEPWHTLAVERLFSWLASEPLSTTARQDSVLTRFRADDVLLRRFLHIHGLERSIAWARRDSSTTLMTRMVTGGAARPLLQDVVIDVVGGGRLSGGSLPGTPFVPVGTYRSAGANGAAWSLLPGHRPTLQRVATDSLPYRVDFERLTPRNADEHLIRIPRVRPDPTTLALPIGPGQWDSTSRDTARRPLPSARAAAIRDPDTTRRSGGDRIVAEALRADTVSPDSIPADSIPVDSAWVLTWAGLEATTDVEAWRRIRTSADVTFGLHASAGLRVAPNGDVSLIGSPPVSLQHTRQDTSLQIVGRDAWAHGVAETVTARHDRTAMTETGSDTSAWAGRVLRAALPNLRDLEPNTPRLLEARTYLRNWDANYERSSIGASVFDVWMDEYAREIGRLPYVHRIPDDGLRLAPDSVTADTSYFAAHRQRRAFRRAVARLTASHGPDLRQWRWERVASDVRYFPVWAADSLIDRDLSTLASTRYAPIEVPASGHPSTPSGGPSILDPTRPAPSPTAWTAWTNARRDHLIVRRHTFDVDEFFSRPFLRRDVAPMIPLMPEPSNDTSREAGDDGPRMTRLIPANTPE
ncbi:penicillin acylase family protein [Longibacter sp.]|uniref:penicillin acylase family protein n=1 Tax=Longibacter sp. TaxID=2045415 RepID=UPI003EBE9F8E